MSGFSSADAAGKISWFWLAGLYFIHTNGELCLSPVGLSAMTKLAPVRIGGMVMGAWFLSIALGNHLAGLVGSDVGKLRDAATSPVEKLHTYSSAFLPVVIIALAVGIVMFVLSRWINKWMHGVK
jgi:POT family proton-dependent oligopeptide transporter